MNAEINWLQIGQSATLFGIGVFSAWSTWRQKKTANVVEKIHVLSNSAMGAQLKLNVEFAQANSVQAHRIAEITNSEGDIAAAVAADVTVKTQEALYQAHQIQQAIVDGKK